MYDLNYTFLTELEVDTRQSFDDLSDDLLLLDYNSEESQVVDMKSAISSWQNYFWQSPNQNKQLLDVTFTDLIIEHRDSSTDYSGNELNDLEMMTVGELNSFLNGVTWAGGKTWTQLTSGLCNAITLLQKQYTTKGNIYPKNSVIVTNENPNNMGFGTWTARTNCYLSERFSASNYDLSAGMNYGSGSIDSIGLVSTATNPPSHTHKLKFMPESGSGGSEGSGTCSGAGATPQFQWFNKRKGLSAPGLSGARSYCNWFSGKWGGSRNIAAAAVRTDVCDGPLPGAEGDRSANFRVSKSKGDPADTKIRVAPKTYPLSSTIWERTN